MAHINFVIPQARAELLEISDQQYFVRDIFTVSEITSSLKTAKQCHKDEGPEFILENFDVFYSILHLADSLQMDTIFKAYEQLHIAAKDLNKSLNFLFEDKDSLSEEAKTKYQNVLKMLMYAYVNIVNVIEQKNATRRMHTLTVKSKGRGKKNEDNYYFTCNHKEIILALNYNIQQDIGVLWDPPIVDELFINMVSEVCYCFLESPTMKTDKEIRTEIWSMLGTLVKNYGHGNSFVVRIVQLIKIHEHLVSCVPEGIQHLVDEFGCKGMVRDFVREITEWQTEEQYTNSQGTRHCSNVLSEMAVLMPTLMIPEVLYLNRYLTHESYSLRNSVLSVIVEVILTVLTKSTLTDEEKESRDDFLEILVEHTADVSMHVRSRVFQHWMRLQMETAVPLKVQSVILEKAVFHLQDKGALVRKSAANCVTIFLEHNMFGFVLKLSEVQEQHEQVKEARNLLKAELEGVDVNQLKALEAEWNVKMHPLRETIARLLETDDSMEIPEGANQNMTALIREYIVDDKFEDAVLIWKAVGSEIEEFREYYAKMQDGETVDFLMVVMHCIFMNIPQRLNEAAAAGDKPGPTEEQLTQLTALDQKLDLLTDSMKFLQHIDQARKPMTDLLESVSISDMQAAVDFFVAAYKFNIDNALTGILEILKMIQRGEQERKDVVLNAFKSVFLTTDTKSMIEHTTLVVDRLIDLLMTVSFSNYPNLALLVSEWISKGTLDNSVIDVLWQYFTKKIEVSDEKSRAALTLLTMAAQGRNTIIKRNIKLVSTIAFGERGLNDILLATQACRILSVAAMEKQNITDENPPFRIKASDSIWKEVCDLFVTFFDKRVKFVNGFIVAAVDFIYRLCSTPIKIIQNVVKTALNKIVDKIEDNTIPAYMIVRCNVMLGTVALKHLNFLDEVVYKELKRRNYIREELKEKKNGKKSKSKSKSKANKSVADASKSLSISIAGDPADESVLEGAQADDTDADFIVEVLENRTVTENTGLGNLADLIVKVCEQPDIYSEEHVQCTSVTALLRYMLVASRFCEKYIQLIFTILERTPFTDVKEIILSHCSDLLERWPNIIEPYTPRIYSKLKDDNVRVRKISVFVLANLILRDMIRAQGHISEVALCIVDKELEISDMAKNFFLQLSHKTNNLYNVLPDIFSHLCETTDDESVKIIMKYLFTLIDKNKQMENLVDRFCAKFKLTENEDISKNIAYCLALINYNEKGLKKLIDNFATYKHLVLNNDIYATFKQITNACGKGGKNEMKVLVAELEEKIKMMFEITEGAVEPTAVRAASKAKPAARKGKTKAGGRKKQQTSSEDSDVAEKENITNTAKKSKRTGARGRKVARYDSDSSD